MDLITEFPLGDDIAVTLLVLGVLAVAALVAGAVVPSRLRRDQDAPEMDDGLGRSLGQAADGCRLPHPVGGSARSWCCCTWYPDRPTTASCARR